MTDHVFTPYESPGSNRRLKLTLSQAEMTKVGRGRWGPHQFTDLNTGTVIEARGASCGSPSCFCAAEVVRVVQEGTAPVPYFD